MLRLASHPLLAASRNAFCRIHLPRRYLATISHSDIPTFLRYAHLVGLDPTKTVFTGTLYEYTVKSALSRLPGVQLSRIGGRDDAGIDLQGIWNLPNFSGNPWDEIGGAPPQVESATSAQHEEGIIPLIVQCKFGGEKSWKGPQYVRELEGALATQPRHALGLLACVRDMTPGMKKQMIASRRAIGFVKVTPLDGVYKPKDSISSGNDEDDVDRHDTPSEDIDENVSFHLTGRGGLLQQFVWNEVANRYLRGFGIAAKYVPKKHGVQGVDLGELGEQEDQEELEQEIVLTWNGVRVLNH